jgi:predicted HAD superfamily phosphohydrolase YqeG
MAESDQVRTSAAAYRNAHSESTAMIGDRMDTDMVANPFRPNQVLDSVADLENQI